MKGPLDGIRVVELGNAIAGPLSAALLGDMGASVVKVEAPGTGDDSRRWGEQVQGESPYFIQYNRSKKSISLDIKSDEGKVVLRRLIRRADVLVENFRPGTMRRLGFPYARLRRLNPGLVYCSVSGFGQTGPYSHLGGYDAIVQAMCGLMAVTGEADGRPLRVGVPITDLVAALYASFSVVLALMVREKTGKGQSVDVSLFESGVSAVAQWATIHALTKRPVRRFGNAYPLLAPYELFEARDRPFVVAVGNDVQWARLCKALGMDGLSSDVRFRANTDRIRPGNRRELTNLLRDVFKTKKASEWISILTDAEVPAAITNRVEELSLDPQLRFRGAFTSVRHAKLGAVPIVSAIPKLSMTPGRVRLGPPTLGEHSEEILLELGYSKRRVLEMKKRRII